LSTDRFFFFDLGVRHAAADLPLNTATVLGNPGPVFEQWVGIELWKRLKYLDTGRLHYFRTKGGAEVDLPSSVAATRQNHGAALVLPMNVWPRTP
jgi:hypothetical protein